MIAFHLNITTDSIPLVWVSELGHTSSISNHCPDHTLILDHKNKQIILHIFGTRVFPSPSPQDILLDLAAHTAPFLTGEGHAGLVWATRGVISTAVPVLVDNMRDYPDYRVVIAGYSLGGGIAQLLALELQTGPSSNLLPHTDNITILAYGSPPVFTSRHNIPVINNLVQIMNADDFMSGVSLRTLTDLLDRINAIKSLNLRRRVLLKMALSSSENDGIFMGFLSKLMLDKNE